MLLPALGKAREKARAVSCVNNLKQCGLAVAMYGEEHSDELVLNQRGSDYNTTRLSGYLVMGNIDINSNDIKYLGKGYLPSYDVLTCPSIGKPPKFTTGDAAAKWNKVYAVHYDRDQCVYSYDADRPLRMVVNNADKPGTSRVSLKSLKSPSTFLIFTDCANATSTDHTFTYHAHPNEKSRLLDFRHSDQLNVLWADSHVSSYSIGTLKGTVTVNGWCFKGNTAAPVQL